MAWFSGKVSLGNFPDLAGAVNKISESVKNIEKNFDNALGFEEKPESSSNRSSNEGLWAFIGPKTEENTVESSEQPETAQPPPKVEEEEGLEAAPIIASAAKQTVPVDKTQPAEEEYKVLSDPAQTREDLEPDKTQGPDDVISDPGKVDSESASIPTEPQECDAESNQTTEAETTQQNVMLSVEGCSEVLTATEDKSGSIEAEENEVEASSVPEESRKIVDSHESIDEQNEKTEETIEKSLPIQSEESTDSHVATLTDLSSLHGITEESGSVVESSHDQIQPTGHASDDSSEMETETELDSPEDNVVHKEVKVNQQANDDETDMKKQHLNSERNTSDSPETVLELEKVKKEMKMMETALLGAARQAQAKADEIAKCMNENEQLKAIIEDLKRKTNEAEVESLREEYHQRVSTLERKLYALTKERDTLRREQKRKKYRLRICVDTTALRSWIVH